MHQEKNNIVIYRVNLFENMINYDEVGGEGSVLSFGHEEKRGGALLRGSRAQTDGGNRLLEGTPKRPRNH